MRILIIEDDSNTVDFLSTAFQIGWPDVRISSTSQGKKGIEMAESFTPDIILLDLGLPDMSGFDVLKQIRSFSDVPIIITTVSGEENYVVKGLMMGANDYITKPLRPLEMIARIKKLTRPVSIEEDVAIECGDMHFGSSVRELYKGEELVHLTSTEGRLLLTLMKNNNRLVSYAELAQTVWGEYYPGVEGCMKVHISNLRRKIEKDEENLIHNTPSIGYMLKATS
jgi:DNA-binding response OmpR family regulator